MFGLTYTVRLIFVNGLLLLGPFFGFGLRRRRTISGEAISFIGPNSKIGLHSKRDF